MTNTASVYGNAGILWRQQSGFEHSNSVVASRYLRRSYESIQAGVAFSKLIKFAVPVHDCVEAGEKTGEAISVQRDTNLLMAAVRDYLELETLDRLYWIGIGLALITGAIHLILGLGDPTSPIGAASVLAAVGYVAAITLILVGFHRRIVVAIGVPYVGSQIILWYVINEPSSFAEISLAAMIDKPVQVLLVAICLVIVYRESTDSGHTQP